MDWWNLLSANDRQGACALTASIDLGDYADQAEACLSFVTALRTSGIFEGQTTVLLDEVTDGDRARATIKVSGSPLPRREVLVVREGGSWKVRPLDDATDIGTPEPLFDADGASPSEVFHHYVSAMEAQDFVEACRYVAESSKQEFAAYGKSCMDSMTKAGNGFGGWFQASKDELEETRVSKDVVKIRRSQVGTVYRMVREGGTWKYDQYGTFN